LWFPSEGHYSADYTQYGSDYEASEAEEAQDAEHQYQYAPGLSLVGFQAQQYG
jgi:hypothetical protein